MLIGGHKTLWQLRKTEATVTILKYQLECSTKFELSVFGCRFSVLHSPFSVLCSRDIKSPTRKCVLTKYVENALEIKLPVLQSSINYCRSSTNSIEVLHFKLHQHIGGVASSLENTKWELCVRKVRWQSTYLIVAALCKWVGVWVSVRMCVCIC